MVENSAKLLCQLISSASIEAIDHWIKKFPPDQKQSAVIASLHIIQEEKRYLTPQLMDALAEYLEMPPIAVYEVVTFYSMYKTSPVGKYELQICTNISCKLGGSSGIVKHLEDKLGIKLGQTTPDGMVTLTEVECLAACVNAPVMQINNKEYHENLTAEKIDAILERCYE